MLYLCCTKLNFTTENPLFIGYSVAIYDKPLLADRPFFHLACFQLFVVSLCVGFVALLHFLALVCVLGKM